VIGLARAFHPRRQEAARNIAPVSAFAYAPNAPEHVARQCVADVVVGFLSACAGPALVVRDRGLAVCPVVLATAASELREISDRFADGPKRRKRRAFGVKPGTVPGSPEPLLTDEPRTPSTAERIEDAESMSMAFLVLLEALSPLERAVYVLREILDYDFAEVAAAVGRGEPACRQLFHRARAHVAERRTRFPAAPAAQKILTASFMTALASGDIDALARLFTGDVEIIPDHGGKAKSHTRVVVGVDRASRYFAGMYSRLRDGRYVGGDGTRLAWVNGAPALLQLQAGVVVGAVVFGIVEIEGGEARIAKVFVVRNPDKLAALRSGLG
jgi:RNA polymerase sigma-70 factor (ECF subfamily)